MVRSPSIRIGVDFQCGFSGMPCFVSLQIHLLFTSFDSFLPSSQLSQCCVCWIVY